MNLFLTYAAGWLGLVVLAIVNGGLREKGYAQRMGERAAHQVSTVIGLVLFGVYIWLYTGLVPIQTPRQALLIGAMWLAMTVAFEFGFGHWVMGHPWKQLVDDYNLLRGRLWLLVPLWTAAAPYLFFQLRS